MTFLGTCYFMVPLKLWGLPTPFAARGLVVSVATAWYCVFSYPDPDFHSCADGLHHRYVKSGSGKVLYSFLSSDYIIRREECIMMPYMEWRESVDT